MTLQCESEKPTAQQKNKRKICFSLIVSLGIFCVPVMFLMAFFFLPTIQALDGPTLNGQTEILSVIASSTGKNYSIQIRAFPETEINNATEFVTALRKSQPDVHMEKVYIQGRGVWNRVLVGHFRTFEEASLYMQEKKLCDAYPGCFVKMTSEG